METAQQAQNRVVGGLLDKIHRLAPLPPEFGDDDRLTFDQIRTQMQVKVSGEWWWVDLRDMEGRRLWLRPEDRVDQRGNCWWPMHADERVWAVDVL